MQRNCTILGLIALCSCLPVPVSAQALKLKTTISAQSKQSLNEFIVQATSTATNLIEQNNNIYSVTVLGERNGNVVPILYKDAQQTKYFPSAAVLLGFVKPPAPKPAKPSPEESIYTPSEEEIEIPESAKEGTMNSLVDLDSIIVPPESVPELQNFNEGL